MKLTRFVIEKVYVGYDKPEKLGAEALFTGPFGTLSVKLSEPLLAEIVDLLRNEAHNVARANAQEVANACNDAAASVLALTHEAAE